MNRPGIKYRWFDWVLVVGAGLALWTVVLAAVVGSYYFIRWTWSW